MLVSLLSWEVDGADLGLFAAHFPHFPTMSDNLVATMMVVVCHRVLLLLTFNFSFCFFVFL